MKKDFPGLLGWVSWAVWKPGQSEPGPPTSGWTTTGQLEIRTENVTSQKILPDKM